MLGSVCAESRDHPFPPALICLQELSRLTAAQLESPAISRWSSEGFYEYIQLEKVLVKGVDTDD